MNQIDGLEQVGRGGCCAHGTNQEISLSSLDFLRRKEGLQPLTATHLVREQACDCRKCTAYLMDS